VSGAVGACKHRRRERGKGKKRKKTDEINNERRREEFSNARAAGFLFSFANGELLKLGWRV
jgi:hypothetical protein